MVRRVVTGHGKSWLGRRVKASHVSVRLGWARYGRAGRVRQDTVGSGMVGQGRHGRARRD